MILRPSRSTRTDTRLPSTTLFRSSLSPHSRHLRSRDAATLDDETGWNDVRPSGALGLRRRQLPPRRRCAGSEEHTSELQSLMRISYAVFCLKNNIKNGVVSEAAIRR